MPVRRELFNRHNDFTAVRMIKMTAKDSVMPGEDLDKSKFKLYYLKELYRRRRIGVRNSDWTKAMLEDTSAIARPEASVKKKKKKATEDVPAELEDAEEIDASGLFSSPKKRGRQRKAK